MKSLDGKKLELQIEELKKRRTLLRNDAKHPELLDREIEKLETVIAETEETLAQLRARLQDRIHRRDLDRPAELEAIDDKLASLRDLIKNAEASLLVNQLARALQQLEEINAD